MYFLQSTPSINFSLSPMLLGTSILVAAVAFVVLFSIYFQWRVKALNKRVVAMEEGKQARMLRASIKFQEQERNRIAADLHDDAGPLLATVRLYLNEGLVNKDKAAQLQAVLSARQIIDDTIGLIRNISHSLMPPTLKNFGLESAATDLFQKIDGSGKIAASARFHDYKDRLSAEREMLAFRILQELVNNIIKHSDAGFIHLSQNCNDHNVFLRLQHDGKGITQAQYEHYIINSKGLGLKNINNRIKVLGASILFDIDPTQGYYKIAVEIPKVEREEK
jgi:two-component system, NarL family, sensor kinase